MPAPLSCARGTTRAIACAAMFSAAAAAQWQIPPGGCAVYRAEEQMKFHGVGKPAERKAPPVARAPHVPLLFHSDLDDQQRRIRYLPNDVRWIGLHVAFDWSRFDGGPVQLRLPWVAHFGDVQVTGRAGKTRDDGWQRIDLRLATVPPRRGDFDDR
ncbi:MAG: hypothetical protein KAI24_19480, partial [Planctomycetes bacterium]|nr:hypothetical protein [Planctomycetota bacterium]